MNDIMPEYLIAIEQMPLWQKASFIFLCLTLALIAEHIRPYQQKANKQQYGKHLFHNLGFLLISAAINSLFTAAFLSVATFNATEKFGLFYLLEIPWYVALIISLLALDFIAQYLCHIALHKIPWLWQLHIVHHNDFHVDASTGTRHHPIDYCTRELAALACFALLGAPLAFYVIYKLISIFFTYFTHANLALPDKLDKLLGLIFVSPNMHKVHHHQYLPYTDSNFGNVLSVWDRLFGTFKMLKKNEVSFGLDTDLKEKELAFVYQLKRPFLAKQQRKIS